MQYSSYHLQDLLVFHDRAVPYHTLNTEQLIMSLKQLAKVAIEHKKPTTVNELTAFQSEMEIGLSHALALSDEYNDSVNLIETLKEPAIVESATLIVHQNGHIGSSQIYISCVSFIFRKSQLTNCK